MGASHGVVCSVSLATAFGCLSLATQLLLFRKNHARLACSVVNALPTAHCRYRLLRILDSRKGCTYGFYQIKMFAESSLPLTGNICDRRLWRIKEASVGAAVDFMRLGVPHKTDRYNQIAIYIISLGRTVFARF